MLQDLPFETAGSGESWEPWKINLIIWIAIGLHYAYTHTLLGPLFLQEKKCSNLFSKHVCFSKTLSTMLPYTKILKTT